MCNLRKKLVVNPTAKYIDHIKHRWKRGSNLYPHLLSRRILVLLTLPRRILFLLCCILVLIHRNTWHLDPRVAARR